MTGQFTSLESIKTFVGEHEIYVSIGSAAMVLEAFPAFKCNEYNLSKA